MTRVCLITDGGAANDEVPSHFFEGCRTLLARVPCSMRGYARAPVAATRLLPSWASLQYEGAGGRGSGSLPAPCPNAEKETA